MGRRVMRLSLSSWKKSESVGDSAGGSGAAEGARGGMRGRAMVLVAVLGLGALGYKMFWPEGSPLNAAAATMGSKSSPTPKTAKDIGVKPRPQTAGSNLRTATAARS